METLRLKPDNEGLQKAGDIIREGGLVAFPTETVYGLGANALDGEAVRSVYVAKGRPSDNPMIVHISTFDEIQELASVINGTAEALIKEFWPGPITFVLPKKDNVPDVTTGGLGTVAVRMPSNETARALIESAKRPIAAPSANRSGKPSPTNAYDVLEDMDGIIDAVIMGEDCNVGIESTVVDVTSEVPVILRPGYVTPDMIMERTGIKAVYDSSLAEKHIEDLDPSKGSGEIDGFKPRSPGMKYKHYAPKAKVILVEGDIDKIRDEYEMKGSKVGVLDYGGDSRFAAHSFFSDLRRLDREEAEIILVRTLEKEGLGFSIMNRMLKSAGYEVIK